MIFISMEQEEREEPPPITLQLYQQNHAYRIALRQRNFHPTPDHHTPKTAAIKPIQKFIGKLRTEPKNHEAILKEMEGLNLSKYVEEISALVAQCVSER